MDNCADHIGSLSSNPGKPLGSGRLRRIVKVLDERVLVFDPPESNPLGKFQKSLLPAGKRVKDMRYAFDRVFDETASQEEARFVLLYFLTIRCLPVPRETCLTVFLKVITPPSLPTAPQGVERRILSVETLQIPVLSF